MTEGLVGLLMYVQQGLNVNTEILEVERWSKGAEVAEGPKEAKVYAL